MDPSSTSLLVQLGIAAPFVLALGWVGKKIWSMYETERKEVQRLNDLMFDKALPALQESGAALREAARFQSDLLAREEIEKLANAKAEDILKSRGHS